MVGGDRGSECIDLLAARLKVNWPTGPRRVILMVQDISQLPVQRPNH